MSERKEFSWIISFESQNDEAVSTSFWLAAFILFLFLEWGFKLLYCFCFHFFTYMFCSFALFFRIYVIRRGGTRVRQSGWRNFEGLDRNPERAETAELADKWRRLSSHTQLRHKQKHKVGEDIDISFISCRCNFWSQTDDVEINHHHFIILISSRQDRVSTM